jgi:signal transduction histidine kinase
VIDVWRTRDVQISGTPLSAENRAHRFILMLLGLQRACYLLLAFAAFASPVYRSTATNLVLIVGALMWSSLLFGAAVRVGWFTPVLAWLDVAVAGVLLIAMAPNLQPSAGGIAPNWTTRMAQASAALVGAVLARTVVVAGALALLVAVQAVVTGNQFAGSGTLDIELTYTLSAIICSALVVTVVVRYLDREGRQLDLASAQRMAAEARLAAEGARRTIQTTYRRALHDTVLTTLTAIARGNVDHRGPQIRQRCTNDAEYIRRLLTDDVAAEHDSITGALHEVIAGAESLGLRVHYQGDWLPPGLPPDAVEAIRDATREALNNVFKHAGVSEVWVNAMWEAGQLRITVVDRGRGFDPGSTVNGFGIPFSIVDRMAAAGGKSRISAEPDGGTCVELTWPQ